MTGRQSMWLESGCEGFVKYCRGARCGEEGGESIPERQQVADEVDA